MNMRNLRDLLTHELKDLYSAEQQILIALPKMIEAVSSKELREGLKKHMEETKEQVSRLELISENMNSSLWGETCRGMEGIIKEGEKILGMKADPALKDAAIIGAAQRVEHYEMASYGCAVTYARTIDLDDVADLLQKTLDEEGEANKTLTGIAEGGLFTEGVNEKAAE